MTPAQSNALRRLARTCAATKNYGPLIAWVESYAERARGPLDEPMRQADGTLAMGGGVRPELPIYAPSWWRRNRGFVIALSVVAGVVALILAVNAP